MFCIKLMTGFFPPHNEYIMNDLTHPSVSIILPCRNEEHALGHCLAAIRRVTGEYHIDAEVIVSDSSEDGSPGIARSFDVRLVKHDREGYGFYWFSRCPLPFISE
ncbi:MAG: glycosyltransferase [Chitinivibrionales bacterium]|nr:glycosyltransferase [Chitinivibrionales bacterium]